MSEGIDPDSGELSADALRRLKTGRVVSLAMISGVLIFAGILIVFQQGKLSDELGLMSIAGLGGSVVAVIMSLVLPPLFVPTFPVESDAPEFAVESVAQTWFVQTVMSMAILELAALSNLTSVMIEHCQYSLAAAGVLVVVMMLRFPTASRLRTWLQQRQQNSGAV
jgi:hypothetical protein